MSEDYCQEDVDRLQCPFTWDMSKFNVDKIWGLTDIEEFIPELEFTKALISAYVQIISEKYDEADNQLKRTEATLKEIKCQIKRDVARHVFLGTKIHFMIRKGNSKDVNEILKTVNSISDASCISPLNEFIACTWMYANYCMETTKIAIKFAEIAVQYNPKSATAHYILARNLRTLRRQFSSITLPKPDEMMHFRKAYELEENTKFALFFAQSLKENRNKPKAMEIFHEIHRKKFPSVSIQLRLALAFIQDNDLSNAKKCLDYIESEMPAESMFLHYKGLYLMKKKEYEEASKYLLKATEENNFPAEMCYIQCMMQLNTEFDFTSHLLKVKEKFSNCEDARRKEILLHIAFSYFFNNKDYQQSMTYFLHAFEIEEKDLPLKNFSCKFSRQIIDVFHFVMSELLPKIPGDVKSEQKTIEVKDKLKKICQQHLPYRPPNFDKRTKLSTQFRKMNI
ncbi:uncharacterized protein LOC122504209 [Leptopilina heterotoma]|uniref:uncharacterized protein LOC122504209 n=1 Tax=Leptopilina heterotoma TaxID=63436 RepID=UPI001CA93FD8|nr:uncharacterized protein LOC122504209 [Leptopilina heterotoma]